MKKIVFGFFTILLVVPVWADTYTIDQRQYVDDATWATKPYRHVLKMGYVTGRPWCTANMVAGKIVTAKHCVLNKDLNDVKFTAFDGTEIYVESVSVTGSYDEIDEEIDGKIVQKEINFEGDWAVLTPRSKYQKFVTNNSIFNVNAQSSGPWANVGIDVEDVNFMVIGCGALKIMSDEEIEIFRRAYVDFLYDNHPSYKNIEKVTGTMKQKTFEENEIINIADRDEDGDDGWGRRFYLSRNKYLDRVGVDAWSLFHDTDRIKVSYCYWIWDKSDWDNYHGCQIWGGNSGGGAYSVVDPSLSSGTSFFNSAKEDEGSYLLGILTRGWSYVGGGARSSSYQHASGADIVPTQFFVHKLPEANKR